jgi:hypothetical protein
MLARAACTDNLPRIHRIEPETAERWWCGDWRPEVAA